MDKGVEYADVPSVPQAGDWDDDVCQPATPLPDRPRFPFVRPRLPAMHKVSAFLELSSALGQLSNFGPNSQALEESVQRQYAPFAEVSACASCTAGLSAALLALGVTGPVLVPGFTFQATHDAVRGAGLQTVTVDVDEATGVASVAAVRRELGAMRAGAVLAVRPYGVWSDLSGLGDACREHGVPLVIDNASGFGVGAATMRLHGREDAIEVFSLHATKPAGIGEGGLLTYPPALRSRVRAALNFGMPPGTAERSGRGLNGKMDEVRAAVARAMLEELPARVAQRQEMAAVLGRLAVASGIQAFMAPGEEWRSPWQCFPLRLPTGCDPDAVVRECARAGLRVRRYYHPVVGHPVVGHPVVGHPVVGHPVGGTPGGAGALPAASALAACMLCLPVYDGRDAHLAREMWGVFLQALHAARPAVAPGRRS